MAGYIITCEMELAREAVGAVARKKAAEMAERHGRDAYLHAMGNSGSLEYVDTFAPPRRGSLAMPSIPGLERGKPRPEPEYDVTVESRLRALENYIDDVAAESGMSAFEIVATLMRRQNIMTTEWCRRPDGADVQ